MKALVSALNEKLCQSPQRAQVVKDAGRLVDAEVRAKSGLSGMAIKTAYKAVSRIRPGLIEQVVDNLLDRFVETLEPFYTEWDEAGRTRSFESHLGSQSRKVANALLSVTDRRASNVDNRTLKKAYNSLRPQGEKNVEAAVPGLGKLIDRYVN